MTKSEIWTIKKKIKWILRLSQIFISWERRGENLSFFPGRNFLLFNNVHESTANITKSSVYTYIHTYVLWINASSVDGCCHLSPIHIIFTTNEPLDRCIPICPQIRQTRFRVLRSTEIGKSARTMQTTPSARQLLIVSCTLSAEALARDQFEFFIFVFLPIRLGFYGTDEKLNSYILYKNGRLKKSTILWTSSNLQLWLYYNLKIFQYALMEYEISNETLLIIQFNQISLS